jgi:hypothetical protein
MVTLSFETTVPIITKGWVQNEIPTKYTLCHLWLSHCDKNLMIFLSKKLEFYNEMTPQGYNLLKKYYLIVRLL